MTNTANNVTTYLCWRLFSLWFRLQKVINKYKKIMYFDSNSELHWNNEQILQLTWAIACSWKLTTIQWLQTFYQTLLGCGWQSECDWTTCWLVVVDWPTCLLVVVDWSLFCWLTLISTFIECKVRFLAGASAVEDAGSRKKYAAAFRRLISRS
jgi:hypothetical protein